MNVNAKVAIISSLTIGTVLGVIGLVFVIKSNKKKDDRKKTSNTVTPQTLVEDPAENANREKNTGENKKIDVPEFKLPEDIFKESYNDVNELLKDVLYYLLRTGFDKDPERLLEKTIRYCTHFIEDYSWYESIPKNIESLENSIRELGYENIYLDSLGITKEEV